MTTSSPAPPSTKRVAAIPAESEFVAFDHIAAGHEGISSNASGSLIIKPCTQAEIDFYESAKDHPLVQAHMPTFIGALSLHDDQDAVAPLLNATTGTAAFNGTTIPSPTLGKRTSWKPSGGKKLSTGLAVVMENVAAGFKDPNILDVKLGARLWADDAPASKKRRLEEVAGRTTSGSLGFRIAGMKIRHHHEHEQEHAHSDGKEDPAHVHLKNGYKSYTKLYGQSFNHDNVLDAFTTYLGGVHQDPATGKRSFRRKRTGMIVKRFIRELESLQYVLENEESRMYSASVLMVYEADEEALERGLQEEEDEQNILGHEVEDDVEGDDDEDEDDDDVIPQKVHEVRLIDFAHASWTPGEGPDENLLTGIRNMVRILRELVS